MQRNVGILVIVFFLICLSFNGTFPLHRVMKKTYFSFPFLANSSMCPSLGTIADRKKKVASDIGNTYQKLKNNTQDLGKNIQEYLRKNEESLKQYEKLVMLKKYPYLDLKEFYLRYSPFGKRHDESEPSNFIGKDVSLCEPPEDCPNVEIINRGLSGFAIPIVHKQSEVKVDPEISRKKSSSQQFLNSLRGEVERFAKDMKYKNVKNYSMGLSDKKATPSNVKTRTLKSTDVIFSTHQ